MPQEYSISIITVNYNGMEDTCALLDCLASNDNNLEVIVVDNGSKNDEARRISEQYPYVRVIASETNLGFAGGNNLGVREAKGELLFFINNDTTVEQEDMYQMAKRLTSSDSVAMVCPKIKFYHGEQRIQFAGFTPLSRITFRNKGIGYGEQDHGQYDTPHQIPYAHGAAMMVKKVAIDNVGMMPECYFLYYEEIDWSMMMNRKGYQIWYEPAATVFHKESQSTGKESALKSYYMTRNRLLFIRRNSEQYRLLSYIYMICLVGSRDIIKNIISGKKEQAKATVKGIIDFIKM